MTEQELYEQYRSVYDYVDGFGIFEVRNLARAFGAKTPSYGRKHDLIMRLIDVASGAVPAGLRSKRGARVKAEDAPEECVTRVRELVAECNARRSYDFSEVHVPQYYFRDSGETESRFGYGDALTQGVLERAESGGYLRSRGCEATADDPAVSESMIQKFGLRNGDALTGYAERIEGVHMFVQLEGVNGAAKEQEERAVFEEIPAVYPQERIPLGAAGDPVLRAADLLCPVGYGQRGLLYAPQGTGAAAFFGSFAAAVSAAAPQAELCLIAAGCGPEKVNALRAAYPQAYVVGAALGTPAADAVRAVRLAAAHCKRVAEGGGNAVVLLDSLTALARLFGEALPSSGRRAAGGTDLNVLHECEELFAAARNLQGAGSVTVLAAVQRAGAADEDVIEKCSPAANVRLYLAPSAGQEGCPPLDFALSHTEMGREMLSAEERACAQALRRRFAAGGAARVLQTVSAVKNNAELVRESGLWEERAD